MLQLRPQQAPSRSQSHRTASLSEVALRLLRSRAFWEALLLVLAVILIVRFFDSILTVVMWAVVVGAILAAVFALATLCVPAPEPRMIVLTPPPETPNTDNRHKAAHILQRDVRGTTLTQPPRRRRRF